MDMEIARVAAFRSDRRHRIERLAAKEGDLDIAVEAMDAQEPVRRLVALPGRTIEGRVPFDRLRHRGNRPFAQLVEPRPGGRLPPPPPPDIAHHRRSATALASPRIPAPPP